MNTARCQRLSVVVFFTSLIASHSWAYAQAPAVRSQACRAWRWRRALGVR